MPKKYLSANELAELFDIPLATVYRWSHMAEGPPVIKVGRHLRYDSAEVDAWVASKKKRSS